MTRCRILLSCPALLLAGLLAAACNDPTASFPFDDAGGSDASEDGGSSEDTGSGMEDAGITPDAQTDGGGEDVDPGEDVQEDAVEDVEPDIRRVRRRRRGRRRRVRRRRREPRTPRPARAAPTARCPSVVTAWSTGRVVRRRRVELRHRRGRLPRTAKWPRAATASTPASRATTRTTTTSTPARTCALPGETICQPCETDEDCGRDTDLCIATADGTFCAIACGEEGACPDNTFCLELGDETPQCAPSRNVCAGCADGDEDGYGVGEDCLGFDCNDDDALAFPGAEELCNGLDDDCDGLVDEGAVDAPTWFQDADEDGFGDDATGVVSCDAPDASYTTTEGGDCDDSPETGAEINPGAAEVCDLIDNDCSEDTPDGVEDPSAGIPCDGLDDDPARLAGRAAWLAGSSAPRRRRTRSRCATASTTTATDTPDGSADPGVGAPRDGEDSDLCAEGVGARRRRLHLQRHHRRRRRGLQRPRRRLQRLPRRRRDRRRLLLPGRRRRRLGRHRERARALRGAARAGLVWAATATTPRAWARTSTRSPTRSATASTTTATRSSTAKTPTRST